MKSVYNRILLTTLSASLFYSLGAKQATSSRTQKYFNAVCVAGKFAGKKTQKKRSLFSAVRFLLTQTLAHALFSVSIDNGT